MKYGAATGAKDSSFIESTLMTCAPLAVCLALATSSLLISCGGLHTPPQQIKVALSVQGASVSQTGIEATDGSNTLAISRVQLVIGSVLLSGAGESASVGTGPFLADLDLTGRALDVAQGDVPRGTYSGAAVTLRHLDPDQNGDVQAVSNATGFSPLLAQKLSVFVQGAFDGAAFTFSSAAGVEQNVSFVTAWTIRAGAPATLSLAFDPTTWFRSDPGSQDSTLLDPSVPDSQSQIEGNFSQTWSGATE